VLGVGSGGVPGQPESFVQCYYPPVSSRKRRDARDRTNSISMGVTGAIALVRHCPFGYFWSDSAKTCQPAGDCAHGEDLCGTTRGLLTRSAINNCRGYFACVNGRSEPRCCPSGYAYTKFGCSPCEQCKDFCSVRTQGFNFVNNMVITKAAECYKRPVWSDPHSFEKYVSHRGHVAQRCPDNQVFNLGVCDCIESPWRLANETECLPMINVNNFFSTGSRVRLDGASVTNVGQALLDSDGDKININVDNGDPDYSGPLVIEFSYRELTELTSRQVLLSSAECKNSGGMLLLTVDRTSLLLEVSREGGLLTSLKLPTAGFKPSEFKTVRIVDSGNSLTLTVTDQSDAYVTRVDEITSPYLQCGLNLGYHPLVEGFRGYVNKLSVYQCVPDSVGV